MNKGDLMRLVYTEQELRNIDSAIPMSYWKEVDTAVHVMNYNGDNGAFGKLENMLHIAKERGIEIPGLDATMGEVVIRTGKPKERGFNAKHNEDGE